MLSTFFFVWKLFPLLCLHHFLGLILHLLCVFYAFNFFPRICLFCYKAFYFPASKWETHIHTCIRIYIYIYLHMCCSVRLLIRHLAMYVCVCAQKLASRQAKRYFSLLFLRVCNCWRFFVSYVSRPAPSASFFCFWPKVSVFARNKLRVLIFKDVRQRSGAIRFLSKCIRRCKKYIFIIWNVCSRYIHTYAPHVPVIA